MTKPRKYHLKELLIATNFENACHGGWFTFNADSLSSDMTSRLPLPHWMPSEQTPPSTFYKFLHKLY